MKMKKTDIGVVGFMYAVCAFFYVYSFDLKKGSEVYPLFTIALLFGLTTSIVHIILVARGERKCRKRKNAHQSEQ